METTTVDKKGAPEVKSELLPGEGKVGTFRELRNAGKRGDNLTPNHVPQSAYIKEKGGNHDTAIAIMMEHPHPGVGGRHRLTRTYGRQPDFSVAPRDELARDIRDLRNIYQKDGLYTQDIRDSLKNVDTSINNKKLRDWDKILA